MSDIMTNHENVEEIKVTMLKMLCDLGLGDYTDGAIISLAHDVYFIWIDGSAMMTVTPYILRLRKGDCSI